MSDRPFLTATRRRFLQQSALALGGLAGASSVASDLFGQTLVSGLTAHLADVSGNGRVSSSDVEVVRSTLFARRGSDLRPAADFDFRADVFGRGEIDQGSLDAVRLAVETLSGSPGAVARRPITVAWHYGWYNHRSRLVELQTVRFKGGDYASWDVEVETLFNEQKNEFGITVDALSWIPVEQNASVLSNYRRGLFQSPNLGTRHIAVLYESTIGLPVAGGRIDFLDQAVPMLVGCFRN